MKKRRILWFGIFPCLAIALALATPLCRWSLIGFFNGESFYAGFPTGYWRQSIQEWRISRPSSDRFSYLPAKVRTLLKLHDSQPLAPLYAREGNSDRSAKADPAALPVLIELLKDPDGNVRCYALDTLRELGNKASRAVPAVVMTLKEDGDATVRRHAAWTLGVIACHDVARARPALVDASQAEDQMLRAHANWALRKFDRIDGEPTK
jgi:hypothetical protein